MNINKEKIVENICYTTLVYGRINKKLNITFSKKEIEDYILNILKETHLNFFVKTGKNYYITNRSNNIRITINSNTFRVITTDLI